jgi:RNA polymerase sigma factor (TIGR02999 family)
MSADPRANAFEPGEGLADLVARADAGDRAARDALFAALYDDLHRLAELQLRRTSGPITLGATTLLHEAYLGIASRDALAFPDRSRFLGYAARAMRGLAINYMRDRRAIKRGGELTFTTLDDDQAGAPDAPSADLDAVATALDELGEIDAPLAELVDLHFFCGYTFAEIAALRSVSERTVQRDWTKARVLLRRFLDEP